MDVKEDWIGARHKAQGRSKIQDRRFKKIQGLRFKMQDPSHVSIRHPASGIWYLVSEPPAFR